VLNHPGSDLVRQLRFCTRFDPTIKLTK
jgi:hypothetical protein